MNLEPTSAFFDVWPESFFFFFNDVNTAERVSAFFSIVTRNPGLPEPACH